MSPQSSSSSAAMKIFVIALCVCAVLAGPEDAAKSNNKPEARARNIRDSSSLPVVSDDMLDKALKDSRFVQRQIRCATGEGPCDPIGRKIKANAPLVLRGMCFKCSPMEIKQIQHVMSHIQKYYPKEYAKVLKQYQGAQTTGRASQTKI